MVRLRGTPLQTLVKLCKLHQCLLNRAYENIVISGPFLFANIGIEVHLECSDENPKELLRRAKNEGKITWGIAMRGDWSLITFSYGASTLQYATTIIPERLSNYRLEGIEISEKGKLQYDPPSKVAPF